MKKRKTKMLSVFRYPGGKTWLAPRIIKWIESDSPPEVYIEPFSGGGIVGLNIAYYELAEKVILCELDEMVASVWEVILGKNWKKLTSKIEDFELNRKNVREIIEGTPDNQIEQAFRTLIINRTRHSGILRDTAGLMKKGENGKGIGSRWYPETLINRIEKIQTIKDRISFTHEDGMEIFEKYHRNENTSIFIDPPYTLGEAKSGQRLYRYHKIDHEQIFEMTGEASSNVILSYSKDPRVRKKSKEYGLTFDIVTMNGNLNNEKEEYLITNN